MINVKELEEFQFTYGDPRPFLHDYLLTLPNISCFHKKIQKVENKVFKFVCDKESKKRKIEPASMGVLKTLEENIASGTDPIIIIPAMLHNKYRCKDNSHTKHMNVLLYNRLTHEVDRLDIKRYHLDGYNMKIFIKRLETEFMDKIVKEHDSHQKLTLVSDVDVPLKFMQEHGIKSAAEAYPVFLLAYVHMRSTYPRLRSDKVVEKVLKLKMKQLESIWTSFKSFKLKAEKNNCGDGLLLNPESSKCMRPLSASFNRVAIEKPVKNCKEGQVYNALLERCISKDKTVDIDILYSEVMPYSENVKTRSLPSLDKTTIQTMNHIMGRYPHAYFIYQRDNAGNTKKSSHIIMWKWNEETKDYDLKLPSNYWDIWIQPLTNPSVRFIITYITLKSNLGGVHANALIYDKNTNEVERFDGLGQNISATYGAEKLDENIKRLLQEQVGKLFKKPVKYLAPLDYCPKFRIFQAKELDDIPGKDLRGNCAIWRLWYINVRMANPHLKRKEAVLLAARKLQQTGSLYKFIKSYHAYIIEQIKEKSTTS